MPDCKLQPNSESQLKSHNPQEVPKTSGGYSHAVEVQPNARYLFISGQIPEAEGSITVPASFEEQATIIWTNIRKILNSADMELGDLVKVSTYLTQPDQATTNGAIRRRFLGDHTPALTVVVTQLLDSRWLLEIEAIAAKRA